MNELRTLGWDVIVTELAEGQQHLVSDSVIISDKDSNTINMIQLGFIADYDSERLHHSDLFASVWQWQWA